MYFRHIPYRMNILIYVLYSFLTTFLSFPRAILERVAIAPLFPPFRFPSFPIFSFFLFRFWRRAKTQHSVNFEVSLVRMLNSFKRVTQQDQHVILYPYLARVRSALWSDSTALSSICRFLQISSLRRARMLRSHARAPTPLLEWRKASDFIRWAYASCTLCHSFEYVSRLPCYSNASLNGDLPYGLLSGHQSVHHFISDRGTMSDEELKKDENDGGNASPPLVSRTSCSCEWESA